MKYSLFLIVLLLCTVFVIAHEGEVHEDAKEVPVNAEVTSAYSLTLGSYKIKISLPSLGEFTGPLVAVGIVLAGLMVYLLVRRVFF